ncbi:MAG TPA: sugar ABC transporter permease [Kofleriaceae bacterium]|nr:sugar ABC transporter permease [Kofleriaceae bacterium]
MKSPVLRQLRDFVLGALVAMLIATCAFVAVRNRELAAHQIDLATRAAEAVADGKTPLPAAHAVIVGEAVASPKHAQLRHRQVLDGGQWRALAAGGGPDDKLIYDAANRFDRTGPFAELIRDGSGRAIAATLAHAADSTRQVAVAVTPPAHPAPYPWLVMIGVLGLGAALAAAGALVAGRSGRAARLGTFAGLATLAIPCVLWQAPVASTAIVLLAAAVALAQRVRLTDRMCSGIRRHRTALGFLAPAAVSMFVLVAAPFLIGLVLGFYDHHQGQWTFVGLDNFTEILSGGGRPLDDPLNFWFILGVTVLWTVMNVLFHVTIGVSLALVLSRKWVRGRGVFRVLFILPWAVPNYITALIWKGMFTGEHGAINSLLGYAGLDGVSWFSSWATSFSANVITNTWLGFPFMMVVALGALETIPRELYEAASVDGASAWQRFRHITLPHLRPALGPAVALGSIWTFNMFNVIQLVSGGNPGGSTNTLVTDAYRWAFERGERYGMAAAYATIIFFILLLWTVFGTRIVRKQGDD